MTKRQKHEVCETIRAEDALKGFSKYEGTPDTPEDHWVGEYWLEQMIEEGGDLATFITKLQHILRNCKKLGFTRVDLDLTVGSDCYDGGEIDVTLRGWRPETPEEKALRLRNAKKRRESAQRAAAKRKLRAAEKERADYERLKKKFEGK